jgi:hypothetical protein
VASEEGAPFVDGLAHLFDPLIIAGYCAVFAQGSMSGPSRKRFDHGPNGESFSHGRPGNRRPDQESAHDREGKGQGQQPRQQGKTHGRTSNKKGASVVSIVDCRREPAKGKREFTTEHTEYTERK